MSDSAEAALVLRIRRVLLGHCELTRAAAVHDLSGEHALALLLMGDATQPLKALYGTAYFGSNLSYCVRTLLDRRYIETVPHGPHTHDRRCHRVRRTVLGKAIAIKLAGRLADLREPSELASAAGTPPIAGKIKSAARRTP